MSEIQMALWAVVVLNVWSILRSQQMYDALKAQVEANVAVERKALALIRRLLDIIGNPPVPEDLSAQVDSLKSSADELSAVVEANQ